MSFKSSISRIGAMFRPFDSQSATRTYLNASVSIYDLERRQREIDSGKFTNY